MLHTDIQEKKTSPHTILIPMQGRTMSMLSYLAFNIPIVFPKNHNLVLQDNTQNGNTLFLSTCKE